MDIMKKKISELEELQEMIEQREAMFKANPTVTVLEDIEEDVVFDT